MGKGRLDCKVLTGGWGHALGLHSDSSPGPAWPCYHLKLNMSRNKFFIISHPAFPSSSPSLFGAWPPPGHPGTKDPPALTVLFLSPPCRHPTLSIPTGGCLSGLHLFPPSSSHTHASYYAPWELKLAGMCSSQGKVIRHMIFLKERHHQTSYTRQRKLTDHRK